MSEIDQLYSALGPSLRGVHERQFRASLKGLEPSLAPATQKRTQLTLLRMRFAGEKSGDFRFHPGVNVLRAGNDKGKSSVLKLIYFCLTGKNELKKDVDGWIDQVELAFELAGVPHAVQVQKKGRPRGRLVRGWVPDLHSQPPALNAAVETLVEWKSGKEMQQQLENFFNQAFGLRPLMGTQKDSRKGSDALLDSTTSYRAYVRGMYINQDRGYSSLLTDGVPYGNLFMKVVGMLLGIRGIDSFFAVEARRARLENELGKEERYHRRVEESLGLRDLATLDEEINRLESYIDELKVERTRMQVRATSGDLDQRLADLTEQRMALDNARQQSAEDFSRLELELRASETEMHALQAVIQAQQAFSAVQPDRCPVCETAIAAQRRHVEHGEDQCVLCHEDLPADQNPEEAAAVASQRLQEARSTVARQRQQVQARRAELDEIEFKFQQLGQQKTHLQAQLRSAFQGTEHLEREIELETRYLGRLEAERENSAQMVSEDGNSPKIKKLLKSKRVLDAVLRHLRTLHAAQNEQMKQDFAARVGQYCTTIGFPGLEEVQFDAQLKPRVRQNGKTYSFEELSPGEKVRFVLAFYLGLAIATGEDLEFGTHPGLLLIDSPGKEEMVAKDFEAVVKLLNLIEEKHTSTLQAIVATSLPAIRQVTSKEKQVFVENDDEPIF